MPRFTFDHSTGKGTLELQHGAQIQTTKTVNGNTVNLDGNGVTVSIVFPNCAATMNLAGITFRPGEHDDVREMMKHFNIFRTSG